MLTQSCKVIKVVKKEIEDEYGQAIEERTEYNVKNVEIQPVSSEDLAFLPAGTLNIGDARAFFCEQLSCTEFLMDFNTDTLYIYNPTEVEISNGEAKLKMKKGKYPNLSTILPKYPTNFNGKILSFICEEIKPSGTEIKYILSHNNGSTWLWFDGNAWVESDGTSSKANTSTELRNNIKNFPYSSGQFLVKVFLISNQANTPILKKFVVSFGIVLELEDIVEDFTGKQYRIITITDYYVGDKIVLKEVYLRKITGEPNA